MDALPSFGPQGRRLAAKAERDSTALMVEEDAAAAAARSTSERDAVDREEAIVFERTEEGSLSEEGGLTAFADKDIAGEGPPEGRTTRTTKAAARRKTRVPLDGFQWTALITAVLMLLAAAGWQLSERLKLKPPTERVVMRLPKYDPLAIASQQAELLLNVRRLQRSWAAAAGDTKAAFAALLLQQQQLPLELAAAAEAAGIEAGELPLAPLLMPAFTLKEATEPEGEEEKTQLRGQLLLLNGVLSAAEAKLRLLPHLQLREKTEKVLRESLPQAEDLAKWDTADFVGLDGFVRVLAAASAAPNAGDVDFAPLAKEEAAAGVPRPVAAALAAAMLASDLRLSAVGSYQAALAPFLQQHEKGETRSVYDFSPFGGRFPAHLFVDFLKAYLEEEQKLPAPQEALLACTADWKAETVLDALGKLTDRREREVELIRAAGAAEAAEEAAAEAAAAVGATAPEEAAAAAVGEEAAAASAEAAAAAGAAAGAAAAEQEATAAAAGEEAAAAAGEKAMRAAGAAAAEALEAPGVCAQTAAAAAGAAAAADVRAAAPAAAAAVAAASVVAVAA
ncbi:hypothetical protein Efla_001416 [Eimeria flavescens]